MRRRNLWEDGSRRLGKSSHKKERRRKTKSRGGAAKGVGVFVSLILSY